MRRACSPPLQLFVGGDPFSLPKKEEGLDPLLMKPSC